MGRRTGIGFGSKGLRRGLARPRLELLEDRLTPAVQLTYSGAGSVLGLLELVQGSTPGIVVSEVAGNLLKIDLGTQKFDASSTATATGLTYEKAGSPTTSTFATVDISQLNSIGAIQATLAGDGLTIRAIAAAKGGIGGVSATAAGIAVNGLDLSAAKDGGGGVSLAAAGSLTVSPGTQLDAGNGLISLAAGVNADGTPASKSGPVTLADAGFETPVVGNGSFRYNPTGSPWTFIEGAGISGDGSGFTGGNPNAPEGVQVGIIQDVGTITQPLTFAGGVYNVSFRAAQRAGQAAFQTIQLTIDGVAVGDPFQPSGTGYQAFTSVDFSVSAGQHTLGFVGLNPNKVDATVFVDAVSIAPRPATLTVGAGATVVSSNPSATAITLRADSMDIASGPIGTFVGGTTIVSGAPTRTLLGTGGTQQFLFDPAGNLFVLDSGDNNVKVFPPGAGAPSYSLKGLQLPNAMAFDASGNLFVGDQFNFVAMYPPGADTPTVTITGVNNPSALAFDASGNLYVANFGTVGGGTTIFVYPPGSTVSTQILNGVDGPTCMVFDAAGNLYVGNSGTSGTNSVSIFAPGAALAPTRQLNGIKGVTALAFDAAGNLYVAGGADDTVSIFAPGASTPYRVLTGLDNPSTLAFDAAGNLLVGNFGAEVSTVMFFKPGATTPASTLTGFSGPIPVIYDASGNLYVGTGLRIQVFNPMGTAGGIVVRTATPSTAIGLGLAGTGLSLSNDELSRLYVAQGGTITFGDASQTGDISLQDVDTLQGGPNVAIQQSPTGGGGVHFVLDDIGGVALNNGSGSLTIVAGTAGVFADNRGGTVAVIQTTGDVKIDTTGPVGTFNNTLGFAEQGPKTLDIGSTYVPTNSVYVAGDVSLVVTGVQASNAPIFLFAGTDLTIVPGAIVNAGSGKVGLIAGYSSVGLGNATAGTLTIGGGAGVVSSSTEEDAITLQGGDMVIAAGAGGATVGFSRGVGTAPVPVAGGVILRAANVSGAINLGTSTGAGINLSNAELAQIATLATGTLTIGDPNHRGMITFSGASPITTPGAGLSVIQRGGFPGSIVFDGSASAALSTGGSVVTIVAGDGGVTAVGPRASLSGTGAVSIDTAGPIGTAASRLLIDVSAPSSLTIGANQAAGAVYLAGLGGFTIGGLTTANAPIDALAFGALNVGAGATVSAGNAAIRLGAGFNPDGTPELTGGTLSVGPGATAASSNAGTSAITLLATDIQIDTSANPATIGGTSAGGLVIRTALPGAAMNLGGSTGNGLNLSNAELARMFTAASGIVTIGDSSRTGMLTFSNSTPVTTNGASLLILQSATGPGAVVLDGTAGAAIRAGSGPITIVAGTGGISATGKNAGLATTGLVTIDTAGPVGSAAGRVLFDPGLVPSSVLIGSMLASTSGVYLGGLSTLTLGNIKAADAPIDVTAASNLTVAANVTVDAGKGKVSLAAGRNPDQTPGAGGILSLASSSLVASDNTARDAITLIGSNVNMDTSASPAVVGSRATSQSTTPNSTLTGFTGPSGLVFDASGNRYIMDKNGSVIEVFRPGATAPITTLKLTSQGENFAVDAAGNVYVTSVTASGISVFAPGATTPGRTLTGVGPQSSLAFDSKGNLFVANPSGNLVRVFKPGSTSSDASFPMSIPFSLAIDADDNVYVACLGGQVSIIAPDLKTVTTLSGAVVPFLVAVGPDGTLYVLNTGQGGEDEYVAVYPRGSTTPTRTLTGFVIPRSMVVDRLGNLYVGNTRDMVNNVTANTVSVFAPGATTATATLAGAIAPAGLTLDSSGNLYVINNTLNTISIFNAASQTPTAGGVVIAPSLPTAQISLGRSGGTGLSFADAQLANIYAVAGGGVTFGGAGYSGNIVGTGSVNRHPGFDTLTLQTTGGTINTNAGVTISAANLALIAGKGIGGATPLAIDVSNLAFATASGPIQIQNSGKVSLTAVGPLAGSSISGDVFSSNTVGAVDTILTSAGVTGKVSYNGTPLAEGATFTLADGKLYKISYAGSSGNDVTITRFELLTEPPGPRPPVPSIALNGSALVIKGTNGDDTVRLVRQGNSLRVYASFLPSDAPFQSFKLGKVKSILIDLRGGNDQATVGAMIRVPVAMNGGAGDDVLIAGGGRTLMIGGDGRDTLVPRKGGAGSLVVNGSTSLDARDDALRALLAEWASNRPKAVRIANLTAGSGSKRRLNGNALLNANTLRDDGVRDSTLGTSSRDWVIAGVSDVPSGPAKSRRR